MKHDAEAKVLCMVTIGRVKLQAQLLDDVKVTYGNFGTISFYA